MNGGNPIRLALIPGDGIGAEVMAEALPVLGWCRSRGRELSWDLLPFGADHYLATGQILPEPAFLDIRDHCDGVLFGAVGDPRIPDGRHAEGILLRLRQELDLAVNFRPCAPAAASQVPLKGVAPESIRLEVFRENTEGPYGLRGRREGLLGVDEAWHTETAVTRLLETAFARAEATRRPLVLAHKANVLKHGHGLWMEVFRACQTGHPRVDSRAMHADAMLCALVQRPSEFGLIAADNYLGDLISDLTAAFLGGMGVAPSLSYAPHRPYRCSALAEPVHGSAPDLAGKGLADPAGMFLSLALLFRHLEWEPEARILETSVSACIQTGRVTPDLGGTLTTQEMGKAVRDGLN